MSVLVEVAIQLARDQALWVNVVDLDWLEVRLVFNLSICFLKSLDDRTLPSVPTTHHHQTVTHRYSFVQLDALVNEVVALL